MARAPKQSSPSVPKVSREKQEEEMLARWRKDYADPNDPDDLLIFPANKLIFNAMPDEDGTICFIATPLEYYELTGIPYAESFNIAGLDEEIWFETMEGVWETETFDTVLHAVEDLQELGMVRSTRLPNPFPDADNEDEEDEEDEEDDDEDDANELPDA